MISFSFRMAIERAGQYHSQHMQRGFRVPAPAGGFQDAAGTWFETGIIRLPHGIGRQMRMDVDWHVQRHRLRQNTVVAG